MSVEKRGLGRPRGSSRYKESDTRLLRRVADLLLARPTLTTRAAILQTLGKDDSAALRRLQGKFKVQSRERWVEEARERVERHRERVERHKAETQEFVRHVALSIQAGRAHIQGVSLALANSPAFQACVEAKRALDESVRRFQDSPLLRELRALQQRLADLGLRGEEGRGIARRLVHGRAQR